MELNNPKTNRYSIVSAVCQCNHLWIAKKKISKDLGKGGGAAVLVVHASAAEGPKDLASMGSVSSNLAYAFSGKA